MIGMTQIELENGRKSILKLIHCGLLDDGTRHNNYIYTGVNKKDVSIFTIYLFQKIVNNNIENRIR